VDRALTVVTAAASAPPASRQVNCDTGTALLIAEQKVRETLAIPQRVYAIQLGEIAFGVRAEGLRDDRA
jgi:ABC-type branched-subunit amino acid transport system ATPase component